MTPFIAPTDIEFKDRFPAFISVSGAVIEQSLIEAEAYVDDTWSSQEDFTLGRMLYAAHTLTLDGHGVGAEAQYAQEGTLGFQTIRSGQITLTRFENKDSTGGTNTFMLTTYGKRFYEIMRRNSVRALVANGTS